MVDGDMHGYKSPACPLGRPDYPAMRVQASRQGLFHLGMLDGSTTLVRGLRCILFEGKPGFRSPPERYFSLWLLTLRSWAVRSNLSV